MTEKELFEKVMEALGNPTRREILALLAKKDLAFAQIMKELEITNSGLLFFHLRALQKSFLIKKENKSEGPYRSSFSLTEFGKAIVSQLEQIRATIISICSQEKQ
jgi:DNA-binding HxlR family transcriptional regulator